MPRRKEVGSRADKKEKKDLQIRTKEGLILLYNRLLTKIESGAYPRDEEIRFLKRFQELLSVAEAREEAETKEEVGLPEGKLKEYVERVWKFKEEVGITNTRTDGLPVMKKARYTLCGYCNEFHKTEDSCPFELLSRNKPISTDISK